METIEGKKYIWKFEEVHGEQKDSYIIVSESGNDNLLITNDSGVSRPIIFANITDITDFSDDVNLGFYTPEKHAISFFDKGAYKYIGKEERHE